MSQWCHICVRNGPCIHTENQARWEADENRKALEREAARRAKEDIRNLNLQQAMEAKWAAEKKSPPPDSKEYWEQVHEDANGARRAAGWSEQPHGPGRKFGKIPVKPSPDPELRSDAGWRRPIGPAPPKAPRKPLRKPAMNLWEVRSRFKVGSSHILIPNSKLAAAIAESAANYKLAVNEQHGFQAFMVLESQQQSSVTAHAEVAFNRMVESHWPTLQFSDLKPISVPFGRPGKSHER